MKTRLYTFKKFLGTVSILLYLLVVVFSLLFINCNNQPNKNHYGVWNEEKLEETPAQLTESAYAKVLVPNKPDTFIPFKTSLPINEHILQLPFYRLLKIARTPERLEGKGIVCQLCKRWRQNSLTEYEFEIQSDVAWKVDTFLSEQDVVDTYQYIRTSGLETTPLLENIRDIKIVEEAEKPTIVIDLLQPDADFIFKLANPALSILPSEHLGNLVDGELSGGGNWIYKMLFADAYQFSSNPDVVNNGFLETLEIGFIADGISRVASVLSGLDHLSFTSYFVFKQFLSNIPNLSPEFIRYYDQNLSLGVLFNTTDTLFQDQTVREFALNVIYPSNMNSTLWDGFARFSSGTNSFEIGCVDYTNNYDLYKLSEAEKLLQSGVIESSNFVSLKIAVGDFPESLALAEYIVDQFSKVGIQATIEVLSRRDYFIRVFEKKEYQIAVGPLPPIKYQTDRLFSTLHSDGFFNSTSFNSQSVNSLITEQSTITDLTQRCKILENIENESFIEAHKFHIISPQVLFWGNNLTYNPNSNFIWEDIVKNIAIRQ